MKSRKPTTGKHKFINMSNDKGQDPKEEKDPKEKDETPQPEPQGSVPPPDEDPGGDPPKP